MDAFPRTSKDIGPSGHPEAMTPAESYRQIAAELDIKAAKEREPDLAAGWAKLALCYLRLAEQADCNSFQDLWFEFGPKTRVGGDGEGA